MSAHLVLVSDQFQRAVSDEFDVLACHLNQLLHIECKTPHRRLLVAQVASELHR